MQRRTSSFEFSTLGMRAAVIPENGRAQRTAVRTKQGGPVHLARKADAADLGHFARMGGGKLIDGADRRLDPGIRILLGPQRRGVRQRKLARGRRDDRASLVHEHRLHT